MNKQRYRRRGARYGKRRRREKQRREEYLGAPEIEGSGVVQVNLDWLKEDREEWEQGKARGKENERKKGGREREREMSEKYVKCRNLKQKH